MAKGDEWRQRRDVDCRGRYGRSRGRPCSATGVIIPSSKHECGRAGHGKGATEKEKKRCIRALFPSGCGCTWVGSRGGEVEKY